MRSSYVTALTVILLQCGACAATSAQPATSPSTRPARVVDRIVNVDGKPLVLSLEERLVERTNPVLRQYGRWTWAERFVLRDQDARRDEIIWIGRVTLLGASVEFDLPRFLAVNTSGKYSVVVYNQG